MANLYVELKYNDGSTKVTSDCEKGVYQYDLIDVPNPKDVKEMLVSSKCDRKSDFGYNNDSSWFDTYGETCIIDTNCYNGGSCVSDLIIQSKKTVFTENVSIVDVYAFSFDDSQYDECVLVFEGKTPPKVYCKYGSEDREVKIYDGTNKFKAIYVPKDSIAEYASTDFFFKNNAKLIQAIPDVDDEMVIDHIKIGDITYKIKGEASDLSNYYTKDEADKQFGTLKEQNYLIGEVDTIKADKADRNEIYTNFQIDKMLEDVNGTLKGKQDALYSGKNIKTINGESILGDGDLKIEGGGKLPEGQYVNRVDNTDTFIRFNLKNFDGSNDDYKAVNFKTINGETLLGDGDIEIQGGGGAELPTNTYVISTGFSVETDKANRQRQIEKVSITQHYFDTNSVTIDNVYFKRINGVPIASNGQMPSEINLELATKDELNAKQDKMTNNYLSKVDVGGSSISIETKAFADESVQKTDTINFKTINGNPIFGMGDIKIEGGDTSNLVTKDEFNSTVGNIETLLSQI